jgi:hypothetical protein
MSCFATRSCTRAGAEKILRDECAERIGDAALTFRNDGGVRNRQAEGAPEDGRHRKPVRHAADHRRFRERAHIAPADLVAPEHMGEYVK